MRGNVVKLTVVSQIPALQQRPKVGYMVKFDSVAQVNKTSLHGHEYSDMDASRQMQILAHEHLTEFRSSLTTFREQVVLHAVTHERKFAATKG